MATYIALDTETTGLPSKRTKDFKNTAVFDGCRVVSVAVVLYDENDKELCHFHNLVKPEGWSRIHSIDVAELHDRFGAK